VAEARAACSSSRVFSLSPGESVLGWRILSVRRKGCGFFFIPSALCLDPVLRPQQNGLRRRVVTQSNGVVCYDADFTPFGGELAYTNACPAQNNYKFEGKERDTETGNDDFGARYYTRRFGRWLSADWSAVPVAVPYANLTNPQTLNLYAMVADDPESFADLDGHAAEGGPEAGTAGGGSLDTRTTSSNGTNTPPAQGEPQQPPTTPTENTAANQQAQQNQQQKTLSADDVSKAIQALEKDIGDNPKKGKPDRAVDFLNALGNNFSVTGETLKEGVKLSKVKLPPGVGAVLDNVSSLTRSGDKVTITNNQEKSVLGGFFKLGQSITFVVGSVSGKPALLNIQGSRFSP